MPRYLPSPLTFGLGCEEADSFIHTGYCSRDMRFICGLWAL